MDAVKENLRHLAVEGQITQEELQWAHQSISRIIDSVSLVIKGKLEAIKLVVIGIMCKGHVLIEDSPGVGKTTLAKTLAKVVGGTFKRIQFTSDLLPSDIIGLSVYRQKEGDFVFSKGPIFANIVLADEINRANPRTQSALLEAMNEGQVTCDGKTYKLEEPFMVLATQNPHDYYGTYPLPESELDRFLLRIQMGYPDAEVEREVIRSGGMEEALENLSEVVTLSDIIRLIEITEKVRFDSVLLDYLMEIVKESREERSLSLGISPRGAIHMFKTAKAMALLDGRPYALPDDIQSIVLPVLSHRIIPSGSYMGAPAERRRIAQQVIKEILERVVVPV